MRKKLFFSGIALFVTWVAFFVSSSASMLWWYQPKTPKELHAQNHSF
jgi:cyclic lactone autoinducer peptide